MSVHTASKTEQACTPVFGVDIEVIIRPCGCEPSRPMDVARLIPRRDLSPARNATPVPSRPFTTRAGQPFSSVSRAWESGPSIGNHSRQSWAIVSRQADATAAPARAGLTDHVGIGPGLAPPPENARCQHATKSPISSDSPPWGLNNDSALLCVCSPGPGRIGASPLTPDPPSGPLQLIRCLSDHGRTKRTSGKEVPND